MELSEVASDISCVCTRVRRLDRSLTRLYDDALAPSGPRVTQYALLSRLAALGPVTLSRLADAMATDRTTLTRNLAPLERAGFVAVAAGADRRTRLVRLIGNGEAALSRARPFWRAAQERVTTGFGRERLDALFAELAAVETLVG